MCAHVCTHRDQYKLHVYGSSYFDSEFTTGSTCVFQSYENRTSWFSTDHQQLFLNFSHNMTSGNLVLAGCSDLFSHKEINTGQSQTYIHCTHVDIQLF